MIATHVSPSIQFTEIDFDRQLADNVCLAMRNAGYLQLQSLHVRVDSREVYLQGRLPSYYLKQVAQHITLAVPGVRTIVDGIVVAR